jgi:hypothetical protein
MRRSAIVATVIGLGAAAVVAGVLAFSGESDPPKSTSDSTPVQAAETNAQPDRATAERQAEAAARLNEDQAKLAHAKATLNREVGEQIPARFWTDYVMVEAVDSVAHTLTVRSTRGPGHNHEPYRVTADVDTIFSSADGIFGPTPEIQPGTFFYFTGTVEAGSAPSPESVRALRIFFFNEGP